MATQTRSPSAASGGGWSSPTNVFTSNNQRASTALSYGSGPVLTASNFGFSIPDGARIDGIVVRIERRASHTNSIRDNTVEISLPGSSAGQNKATASYWGTSDTYVSYGSSTDLWGRTSITPDQINSSNFAVRFGPFNNYSDPTATRTAYIDHIEVIVHYTEPGTVTGTVRDASDLTPLSGVSVSSDDGRQTTTNASGNYSLTGLTVGTRQITYQKDQYLPKVETVSVSAGSTVTKNVDLVRDAIIVTVSRSLPFAVRSLVNVSRESLFDVNAYVLHGLIRDKTTLQPISGATITLTWIDDE